MRYLFALMHFPLVVDDEFDLTIEKKLAILD